MMSEGSDDSLDRRQADRASEGPGYLPAQLDDFGREVALTRRNAKLMALLDERARQTTTVPLDEVKRQLGLG